MYRFTRNHDKRRQHTRPIITDRERENKRIVILVSFKNLFPKVSAVCCTYNHWCGPGTHGDVFIYFVMDILYHFSPYSNQWNCCFGYFLETRVSRWFSFFGIGGMEAIGIKSVRTRLNLPQGRSFETFFYFFFSVRLGPGCKRKIKDRKPLSL